MGVTELAVKFTLVDALSAGVQRLRSRVLSLGKDSKKVKQDFDQMTDSFAKGAKAFIAVKGLKDAIAPGVREAASLEKSSIALRSEIWEAGKATKVLNKELESAKKTAFLIQAKTPFDQTEILDLITALKKSGAELKDVLGETGAAAAAAGLAALEDLSAVQTGQTLISIATPFGAGAKEYFDIADKLKRYSSASQASVDELGQAFTKTSATAAELGSTIEDTILGLAAISSKLKGPEAGTAYKQFLLGLTGKTPEARKQIEALNRAFDNQFQAFDESGKMRPMLEIVNMIRATIGQISDPKRRIQVSKRIFDEVGMEAALSYLNKGKQSIEEIGYSAGESMPLQQRIFEYMRGFSADLGALGGTSKSVLAALFLPALNPLRRLVDLTNDLVTNIGKAAGEGAIIPKIVSYGSLAGIGAGGAYGIYHLAKAARAGRKVLKGVGGFRGLFTGGGGVLGGVVAGKALEKTAGVNPVFVTNWPAGFGLGGGKDLEEKAERMGLLGGLGVGVRRLATIALPLAAGVGLSMYLSEKSKANIDPTVLRAENRRCLLPPPNIVENPFELDPNWYDRANNMQLTVNVAADGSVNVENQRGLDRIDIQARRHGATGD